MSKARLIERRITASGAFVQRVARRRLRTAFEFLIMNIV